MTRTTRGDSSGFTLVELLITVVIAGLVMGPLSGALIVGFRTTGDTRTSLQQSNAEQLISTYVAKDIQAAEQVSYSPAGVCGGKVEFRTRSTAMAASADTVYAYTWNGTTLSRLECDTGGTPLTTLVLASNVSQFDASGSSMVHVSVTTTASPSVPAYAWSIDVARRLA